MKIQEAIEKIISECPNPYAVTYAKAFDKAKMLYGEKGVHTQILYILSNLVDLEEEEGDIVWHGETAEEVIKTLQNFVNDMPRCSSN